MSKLTAYQKLYQKNKLNDIEGCILYSGVYGGDEERSMRAAEELARYQAVEAAAKRVLVDGHTESPYYMDLRDHNEALEKLAAALEGKK